MTDISFVDKVKKFYGYLENEYDFKIILTRNSDIRPQTDGLVKYASNTTLIIIGSEIGQVSVRFCRVQDNENYCLDPVSIHEFMTTSDDEKMILLSRDKKDKINADVIINKTNLLTSNGWKIKSNDVLNGLERQLINFSKWLKDNANLCLLGDFSRWPTLFEYVINRSIADELRSGGKEFVLAVVKDENGKLKQIERPIFQREKDHLAQLKKEIG